MYEHQHLSAHPCPATVRVSLLPRPAQRHSAACKSLEPRQGSPLPPEAARHHDGRGSLPPRRPEIPFGGLPALVQQIRADIGVASGQLESFTAQQWRRSPFFKLARDPAS